MHVALRRRQRRALPLTHRYCGGDGFPGCSAVLRQRARAADCWPAAPLCLNKRGSASRMKVWGPRAGLSSAVVGQDFCARRQCAGQAPPAGLTLRVHASTHRCCICATVSTTATKRVCCSVLVPLSPQMRLLFLVVAPMMQHPGPSFRPCTPYAQCMPPAWARQFNAPQMLSGTSGA